MSVTISSPLTLPCGATLKNRLAKGAMTEGLGDPFNRATGGHVRLRRRWAEGGAGMLLTGNVQVDRSYLERPGNVAIDGVQSNEAIAALREYAKAGTANDTHLWMQISHSGRQTPASVNKEPVGPSGKALDMPGAQFGKPRALTGAEIGDVIARFAHAAAVARDTGFTGVQIHGAHGYLISEFLSPDVNTRTDEWGGTYEQPRLVGLDDMTLHPEKAEVRRESTIAREAYFLEYAKDIRAVVKMPLMVTGGFRTLAGMNAALGSGTMDVVGIARPLRVDPAIPAKLLSGVAKETPAHEKTLRLGPGILGPHSPINLLKALNGRGQQGRFCLQLLRMGEGKDQDPKRGVFSAFRNYAKNEARAAASLQR
ncbi:MAG: NADH:flavin oxidoreductase [Parvibaculum sp.]|nr:NADH:flavin oxidoreductase [Parvibaculum sp.]